MDENVLIGQPCLQHSYVVVEWDGDTAKKLLCSHCLKQISYRAIREPKKKPIRTYTIWPDDDVQD